MLEASCHGSPRLLHGGALENVLPSVSCVRDDAGVRVLPNVGGRGGRVVQGLFFETVHDGSYSYRRLNRAAINDLRSAPAAGGDEEVAHALIDLLIDDLPEDPQHDGLMDNSETGAVIRCLKTVLRRLGIEFEVPFHDKQGYYSFRMEHENDLSTDLTRVFAPGRAALERREQATFTGGLRGLRGELRNLIFAATQKPEIVWRDVAGGVIEITKNKDHCLLYDRPVGAAGLTWSELVRWWQLKDGMYGMPEQRRLQALLTRLRGRSTPRSSCCWTPTGTSQCSEGSTTFLLSCPRYTSTTTPWRNTSGAGG